MFMQHSSRPLSPEVTPLALAGTWHSPKAALSYLELLGNFNEYTNEMSFKKKRCI